MMNANGQVRTNFAIKHLIAAAKMSREVARIEQENAKKELGGFFDDILGNSSACIMLAAAGGEAFVHEIVSDRKKHLSKEMACALDACWRKFSGGPVQEKYILVSKLCPGKELDCKSEASKSYVVLTRLRNELIHFYPEWTDEAEKHMNLSKALLLYTRSSPWFPDEPLFPRAWASHETTKWAVSAVVEFIKEFSEVTGITNELEKFASRLDPTPPHSDEQDLNDDGSSKPVS